MIRSIYSSVITLCLALPCAHADSHLPFGQAAAFNAFVFGDFKGQSDVEGRLAAGGNVELVDGFSVGDKLYNANVTCLDLAANDEWPYQLVSGGTLDWNTGRLYYGSIAVGSLASSSIGGPILNGLAENCSVEETTPVDFTAAESAIKKFSHDLHGCTTPTGTAYKEDEVLIFEGTFRQIYFTYPQKTYYRDQSN